MECVIFFRMRNPVMKKGNSKYYLRTDRQTVAERGDRQRDKEKRGIIGSEKSNRLSPTGRLPHLSER